MSFLPTLRYTTIEIEVWEDPSSNATKIFRYADCRLEFALKHLRNFYSDSQMIRIDCRKNSNLNFKSPEYEAKNEAACQTNKKGLKLKSDDLAYRGKLFNKSEGGFEHPLNPLIGHLESIFKKKIKTQKEENKMKKKERIIFEKLGEDLAKLEIGNLCHSQRLDVLDEKIKKFNDNLMHIDNTVQEIHRRMDSQRVECSLFPHSKTPMRSSFFYKDHRNRSFASIGKNEKPSQNVGKTNRHKTDAQKVKNLPDYLYNISGSSIFSSEQESLMQISSNHFFRKCRFPRILFLKICHFPFSLRRLLASLTLHTRARRIVLLKKQQSCINNFDVPSHKECIIELEKKIREFEL